MTLDMQRRLRPVGVRYRVVRAIGQVTLIPAAVVLLLFDVGAGGVVAAFLRSWEEWVVAGYLVAAAVPPVVLGVVLVAAARTPSTRLRRVPGGVVADRSVETLTGPQEAA